MTTLPPCYRCGSQPCECKDGVSLYLGDCREILPALEGATAVVTDPPYGIGFMGKAFDTFKPGYSADNWAGYEEQPKTTACMHAGKYDRSTSASRSFQAWCEGVFAAILSACLPGAPLLSFGGTRTLHRLTCAIEDAGWEIRDCLMWVFGSGFPKSHNVANAIDKAHGAEDRGHRIARASAYHPDGTKEPSGDALPAYESRTEHSEGWAGYGTALKPSYEPIVLAMKPLDGTYAANALEHGVAGLAIDKCRIPTSEALQGSTVRNDIRGGAFASGHKANPGDIPDYQQNPSGRWPANLIHDGSDEVVGMFPESVARPVKPENIGKSGCGEARGIFGIGSVVQSGYDDKEPSAARFFYTAKASPSDRGNLPAEELPLFGESIPEFRNTHPTVKPLALMEYLVKLVTMPARNLILDPFAGSGTTGVACKRLGLPCVLIESEAEYCEIAKQRLESEPTLLNGKKGAVLCEDS